MTDKILELASKHLGRTSDGGVMKPYITPTTHDPNLLQPIPRELNREKYNITSDIFTGFDIWNCYETSFLNEKGYPVSGITRIIFDSNTENVVESKSLKLFLNSFNMEKIGNSNDFENLVSEALADKVAACRVLFIPQNGFVFVKPWYNVYEGYSEITESEDEITHFTEAPELLKLTSGDYKETKFHFASLRSNCRVTNQPDFGDMYVNYEGPMTLVPESLLKYLISFRGESHFHEEVVEMVYKRLYDLNDNIFTDLSVSAFYTRRGGIDISPVRYFAGGKFAKHVEIAISSDDPYSLFRTLKQ